LIKKRTNSFLNVTGFKSLKDGEKVNLGVEQGPKGPIAVNVTVV